jgi:imidazolonepropionase-like amidohydrolase
MAATGVPYPDAVLAKAKMVLEEHTDSVRKAIAAGVTVAMGTDSGVGPHGRNLSELQLLVECGMTPEQALHAATQSACELLDVAEDRGTIAPGQRADLVVVDGDPREIATLATRIRAVYQDGLLVSTPTHP